MAKWVCDVCGYVYDPEVGDSDNGVAAGTAWEDVPEEWVCPLCGVGKDQFSEILSDKLIEEDYALRRRQGPIFGNVKLHRI